MRREINMCNLASPGACWVMECQECFDAVLITGTLDHPLINRLVTAKITPPLSGCACVSVITFPLFKLCIHILAPA